MAGKRKHADEPASKTARASLGKKGNKDEFQASGEINRIVSLAGGEFVYVLDPRSGRTHRLRVGSDRWDLVLTELLDSNHGDKIRTELLRLGFPFPVMKSFMDEVEANTDALLDAVERTQS